MPKLTETTKNARSLTLKISPELYDELQLFREAARIQGSKFNVSEIAEAHLMKVIKNCYKNAEFTQKSLKDAKKIIKEKTEKKTEKKAETK